MGSDDAWEEMSARLKPGTIVSGRVSSHHPWGTFVNINEKFPGLIEVPNLRRDAPRRALRQEDYPLIGSGIEAVVVQLDSTRKQVRLSLRRDHFEIAMAGGTRFP